MLKLMYAALIRPSEGWRGVRVKRYAISYSDGSQREAVTKPGKGALQRRFSQPVSSR